MPVEPLVALKTRPEQNWNMGVVSNSVNLGVSMAGKEGGKVLPLKKLSKVS